MRSITRQQTHVRDIGLQLLGLEVLLCYAFIFLMQVLLCFSLFLYVLFHVLSHMRLSCVNKYDLLTYYRFHRSFPPQTPFRPQEWIDSTDIFTGPFLPSISVLYFQFLHYSLWSPYVIGQTIIFLPCSFFPSFFLFFPRLISAVGDWMSAILLHMAWPQCEFRMQV